MPLIDDYVDLDPIEAPSYDVPDNIYDFTLGDARIQEGTKNDPDKTALIFEYKLIDENEKSYTYSEWFFLPLDSNMITDKEKTSLGYLKLRLISLGVPEAEVNTVEAADLIGTYGTLQIKTTVSKGKQFQNVRNLRVEEAPEVTAKAAAPVVKAAEKPKRTRRTKAQMEAEATAADEPESSDELETEPESMTPEEVEAAVEESESDDDIKARIAARRAARKASADTSGERKNPFAGKA